MLEVKNVSKAFPVKDGKLHAVRDVSFRVAQGEIYGIIGLSGAGKSTLLRCINALERPDTGEILFDGDNLLTMKEEALLQKRKEIGMIFQGFHLLMQKNALQNVLLPSRFHHADKNMAMEKALEMLELVGLSDKKDAYPANLSGGQKQRLAIARALVMSPRLLLSDEATSALDPQTTEQILRLMKKIVQTYGLSIVMITHQMEVAKEICDTVAVMENGTIIEQGPVHDMFLRPKKKRTREMILGLSEEESEPSPTNGRTVYRLGFEQYTATSPVISRAVRQFDVDINILAGNIHQLKEEQIGMLYVEIWGDTAQVDKTLAYLTESGISWEVSA